MNKQKKYEVIDFRREISSCILCGSEKKARGKLLHGHYVCEDCVDYVLKLDDNVEPAQTSSSLT